MSMDIFHTKHCSVLLGAGLTRSLNQDQRLIPPTVGRFSDTHGISSFACSVHSSYPEQGVVNVLIVRIMLHGKPLILHSRLQCSYEKYEWVRPMLMYIMKIMRYIRPVILISWAILPVLTESFVLGRLLALVVLLTNRPAVPLKECKLLDQKVRGRRSRHH